MDHELDNNNIPDAEINSLEDLSHWLETSADAESNKDYAPLAKDDNERSGSGNAEGPLEVEEPRDTSENEASVRDTELLEKLGITAGASEAVQGASFPINARNSIHVQNIKSEASNMIARHRTPMQPAKTVFDHLKEHGLGISEKGIPLTKANCIGDALGKHGLNLPRVRQGGRLYYDLSYVECSDQEKSAAQERLDAGTATRKQAIPPA